MRSQIKAIFFLTTFISALLCANIASAATKDIPIPPVLTELLSTKQQQVTAIQGNPKGDVTLLEFTDYNCPYCKMMTPVVANLIKQDKNLRVLVIEYPVISPTSADVAQIALAAVAQNKFSQFHLALMQSKQPLTSETIMQIAQMNNLNVQKLNADMHSAAITKEIANNLSIGDTLGVPGTPTFVIAPTSINGVVSNKNAPKTNFGFVPIKDLQNAIKAVRG